MVHRVHLVHRDRGVMPDHKVPLVLMDRQGLRAVQGRLEMLELWETRDLPVH